MKSGGEIRLKVGRFPDKSVDNYSLSKLSLKSGDFVARSGEIWRGKKAKSREISR